MGTGSLWKQLDVVVKSLKGKTAAKQLQVHGDNQSVRVRRQLTENKKRHILKKQFKMTRKKPEPQPSPDSNSKSPLPSSSGKTVNFVDTVTEMDVVVSDSDEISPLESEFSAQDQSFTDAEQMETSGLTALEQTEINLDNRLTICEAVVHSSSSTEINAGNTIDQSNSDQITNCVRERQQVQEQRVERDETTTHVENEKENRTADTIGGSCAKSPHRVSKNSSKGRPTEEGKKSSSKSTSRKKRGKGKNATEGKGTASVDTCRRITRSAKKNLNFSSEKQPHCGSDKAVTEENIGEIVALESSKSVHVQNGEKSTLSSEEGRERPATLVCDRKTCDKRTNVSEVCEVEDRSTPVEVIESVIVSDAATDLEDQLNTPEMNISHDEAVLQQGSVVNRQYIEVKGQAEHVIDQSSDVGSTINANTEVDDQRKESTKHASRETCDTRECAATMQESCPKTPVKQHDNNELNNKKTPRRKRY